MMAFHWKLDTKIFLPLMPTVSHQASPSSPLPSSNSGYVPSAPGRPPPLHPRVLFALPEAPFALPARPHLPGLPGTSALPRGAPPDFLLSEALPACPAQLSAPFETSHVPSTYLHYCPCQRTSALLSSLSCVLSSHSRRIGPQDALKKDSRGLSWVAAFF